MKSLLRQRGTTGVTSGNNRAKAKRAVVKAGFLAVLLGTAAPAPAPGQLLVPPDIFVELFLAEIGEPEDMLRAVESAHDQRPDLAANIAAQAITMRPDLEAEILDRLNVTKAAVEAVSPDLAGDPEGDPRTPDRSDPPASEAIPEADTGQSVTRPLPAEPVRPDPIDRTPSVEPTARTAPRPMPDLPSEPVETARPPAEDAEPLRAPPIEPTAPAPVPAPPPEPLETARSPAAEDAERPAARRAAPPVPVPAPREAERPRETAALPSGRPQPEAEPRRLAPPVAPPAPTALPVEPDPIAPDPERAVPVESRPAPPPAETAARTADAPEPTFVPMQPAEQADPPLPLPPSEYLAPPPGTALGAGPGPDGGLRVSRQPRVIRLQP